MDTLKNWRGLISALLYPVQFEQDYIEGLDRVLTMVVKGRALDASPAQYLEAVRTALKSPVRLAELIPQRQSEEQVRRYLTEARRRLIEMVEV